MIVSCPQCRKRYDDAQCWTICPHSPLHVAADAPYCRRHDLFNCYLCKRVKEIKDSIPPGQASPL
jgi:hypothetical protein